VPATGSRSARSKAVRPVRQILIVDDEESLAFFLRQGLLEVDAGWQIDTANTGEEAVIKINRYAYGLIIADLRMPGLNGLELLQMLRALEPNTKVILMTAYGSEQVAQETQRLQAYRYVTKPFQMEDMQAWASEVLGQAAPPKPAARTAAEPVETPSAPPAPSPAAPQEAAEGGDALRSRLVELRTRMGAAYVFVSDAEGAILADAGSLLGVDAPGEGQVNALVAAMASSLQDARAAEDVLGGPAEPTVLLQEGARYGAGAAAVGARWLVGVVYARAAHRAKSVLDKLRAAAPELAGLLPGGAPLPPVGAERAQSAPQGEDDLLSWEQAQAMGLVDSELLSRLSGTESGGGVPSG